MKKLLSLAIVSLLLTMAVDVNAAAMKIGVINLDQVLQKSPLGNSYNQKLSDEFRPRQDEVNAAQKKLQDDVDKLIYTGYSLNADTRAQLQATVNDDKNAFDQLNAKLQKDIAAAQRDYSQQLLAKMNTIVAKIGKDNGYDLIQSSNNVLYLNNAVDLTSQVIDQLK